MIYAYVCIYARIYGTAHTSIYAKNAEVNVRIESIRSLYVCIYARIYGIAHASIYAKSA